MCWDAPPLCSAITRGIAGVRHSSSPDKVCVHRAGEATGAQAPPLSHVKKNVGYAWSALRAIRPELAAVAVPLMGVALLLGVRMLGLQVHRPCWWSA